MSERMKAEANRANLFVGCIGNGMTYCDRTQEEHGDYKKIAHLSFGTLKLTIWDEESPLLDFVKESAADIQARRGTLCRVSTCGQSVILGHDLPEDQPEESPQYEYCFYQHSTATIIDVAVQVNGEYVSAINRQTLAQIKRRYPGCVLMPTLEAIKAKEEMTSGN